MKRSTRGSGWTIDPGRFRYLRPGFRRETPENERVALARPKDRIGESNGSTRKSRLSAARPDMENNQSVTKMQDPNFPIELVRLDRGVASQNGRHRHRLRGATPPALTGHEGGRCAPCHGSETSAGDSIAQDGWNSLNQRVGARNDHEWEPIDTMGSPVDTVSGGSKGETLASPGKVQSSRCQRESQHQDQAVQSEADGATDDLTIDAHHQQPQFSCLSEGAEPRAGAVTEGAAIINRSTRSPQGLFARRTSPTPPHSEIDNLVACTVPLRSSLTLVLSSTRQQCPIQPTSHPRRVQQGAPGSRPGQLS